MKMRGSNAEVLQEEYLCCLLLLLLLPSKLLLSFLFTTLSSRGQVKKEIGGEHTRLELSCLFSEV